MQKHMSRFLTLVAVLLGSALVVHGQDDYKVDEPDKNYYYDPADPALDARQKREFDSKIRQQLGIVRDLLSEGVQITPERDRLLRQWYLNYYFPSMTVPTDAALSKAPDLRKLFVRDLDRSNGSSPAVHDFVVDLAYEYFSRVAVEDYHPAARYNAMLIVGSLNLKEKETSGGNPRPPIPLGKAFTFMLEQFENKDQIDAVRLGALLGIQRHVQLEAQFDAKPIKIPAAELDRLRTDMLNLVNTTEPPGKRTVGGHNWLRRRGVEILSWMGAAKIDQKIFDTLLERLTDSEEDRGVRSEASLALGNIMYIPDPTRPAAGATPIQAKPREVAAELARFVFDTTQADIAAVDAYIKSIEESEKIYSGTGGGGAGFGGFGGPSGSGPKRGRPGRGGVGGVGSMNSGFSNSISSPLQEDPYGFRIEPVYRKLRYEISCAMRGIRGSDDWSNRPATGGVSMLVPAMTADLYDPKNKALKDNPDRLYIDTLTRSLKSLAERLRVKNEELDTYVFDTEVRRQSEQLKEIVREAIPLKKADPKAKPAAAVEDPLAEVDPAAEPEPELDPAATAPAPEPIEPAPGDVEPGDVEPEPEP